MSPKKQAILINCLSAKLGGGQTYILNILKAVPRNEEVLVYVLPARSLNVKRLPKHIKIIKSRLNLDNPFLRMAWETLMLPYLVKKLGLSLIFFPGGTSAFRIFGPSYKVAVTFQNMLPFDLAQRDKYPLGYRLIREILLEKSLSISMKKADLVIFISTFAQKFISRKLGILNGDHITVHHGVHKNFFAPSEIKSAQKKIMLKKIGAGNQYISYVSYIDFYKDHDVVVDAFVEVKKKPNYETLKLVFAGSGNPEYIRILKRKIVELELESEVIFVGQVSEPELIFLYQSSRINVFASNTENCPNIVLEMMASGAPSIVTDVGPMPELGGDTVTYFKPSDVHGLVSKILGVLDFPELYQQKARLAVDRAHNFSWEESAQKTWEAIEKIRSF